MSKRVFLHNYSEDAANPLVKEVKEDSEEKLTYFFVVILLLLSLSFCNMYISLLREVSILQEKVAQLLDLPFM